MPRSVHFTAVHNCHQNRREICCISRWFETAAITARNCTTQLMTTHLTVVITTAETAAECNMLLAAVVPAITKNRYKMSLDIGIHVRFQTAAQMISQQLEPLLNDLKTTVKCMFSCSDYYHLLRSQNLN